jgi:hypothetical protein
MQLQYCNVKPQKNFNLLILVKIVFVNFSQNFERNFAKQNKKLTFVSTLIEVYHLMSV